ncbi:hypothetical protein TVAG_120300 [Trichomonas vaginalis G3]|uniref:Uncharacterized protein n=1 Tax=Trichomonas vaginalis (strain ATCC PRA-98 / G3) TaxID=412133 RepID=A2D7H5_TRIV3|nr:profilin binding [Trichomonas vaginalis G3]EAY23692.1 hypothetical protein TVAG_120300 [Trichomonas vaginalis G3]KAI5490187.1 profilin binding [Trichomonas vaginalis G3]|eukprot:XP_001276940.1 hypothetical protein [Trichomonas vaginalis G3]
MTVYIRFLEVENFEPKPLRSLDYTFSANEAGNRHTTYFYTEGPKLDFKKYVLAVNITKKDSEIILHIQDGDYDLVKQIALLRVPLSSLPKDRVCTASLKFINIRMYSPPEFEIMFHYDTIGARKFEADDDEFDYKVFKKCYDKQMEFFNKSREMRLQKMHQKQSIKTRNLQSKKRPSSIKNTEEEEYDEGDEEWADVPTDELEQQHTFPQFRAPDSSICLDEINLKTIAPELTTLRSVYVPPPNVVFRPPQQTAQSITPSFPALNSLYSPSMQQGQ